LHGPHRKDLVRKAWAYLTLPAMTADPKHEFSGTEITFSDRSCRMGDNVLRLSRLECFKSWQRDGTIAGTKEDVEAIEQMLDSLCEEDLV
jgi:hypothetical protein